MYYIDASNVSVKLFSIHPRPPLRDITFLSHAPPYLITFNIGQKFQFWAFLAKKDINIRFPAHFIITTLTSG